MGGFMQPPAAALRAPLPPAHSNSDELRASEQRSGASSASEGSASNRAATNLKPHDVSGVEWHHVVGRGRTFRAQACAPFMPVTPQRERRIVPRNRCRSPSTR